MRGGNRKGNWGGHRRGNGGGLLPHEAIEEIIGKVTGKAIIGEEEVMREASRRTRLPF